MSSSSIVRGGSLVSLLALLVTMTACSGTGRIQYNSPQEAYEKGIDHYEDEDYDKAIEYLRGVFDFGRTNEWADDAQYYLGRAYYESRQYILAASEFRRFTQLYRTDPRAEEAAFQEALCAYQQSPSYQLDQTSTEQAIERFVLFVNLYPGSSYVEEANTYIGELRTKLARKQYEAAALYMRRSMFEAAAVTYEAVFDRYPDTAWADNALLGAMRAYMAYADASVRTRRAERLEKAVENFDRLLQIPNANPQVVAEAQLVLEDVQERLADLEPSTADSGTL